MDSFAEAWAIISDYCKNSISTVAYNSWFSRLKPVSLDFVEGLAIIEAPNQFHKQTLEKFYLNTLNDAFASVFGDTIKYRISVQGESGGGEIVPQPPITNGQYELTFENFIVGPSNKFAYAACQAVATQPSQTYNPLFIWGNSGLGKTHLLKAIMHELELNHPDFNIVYVTGEDFANEIITAIGRNTTAQFREKYRKANVLLVDDIQFIAGKDSTQTEFFYTFNTLYESGSQIILVSDRPTKDIANLEDRLRTRFDSGLTADVQPPDFETRVAIINRKASALNISLSPNVCEFIAGKLKSNIRQLEGVVKKLQAFSMLDNKPPSITTAQKAISDILNLDQPAPVTVDRILEEVARTYGVTAEDIKSPKRAAKISVARQVAAYVIKDITQMSMKNIGEALGGRDHSTIVYATSVVEQKIASDSSFRGTVDDIIKNIRDK